MNTPTTAASIKATADNDAASAFASGSDLAKQLCPLIAEQPLLQSVQADLVIENAKIFLPGKNHVALAIKQNRILPVGSQAEIEALVGPKTARLDASGC